MKINKKYIILAILFLFCSVGVEAQKRSSKKNQELHNHYIDIFAGGGVSSLGYSLLGGENHIAPTFTAGVGYTYYFLPYMGLQTGLHVTRYASNAYLTEDMLWNNLTDYQGDLFNHRIAFQNWKERQQTYLLEIPVGLRFQTRKKKVGFYGTLGAKLGLPVYSNYLHKQGTLINSAYYPNWDLEVSNLPGRFETETLQTPQEGNIKQHLRKLNAVAYAELGVAFRTGERADLYLAAYGQYCINNFSAVSDDERTPLGFASDNNHAYEYMQPYNGLMGTDHVGAMHPWTAGLKLGISIYPGWTKAQRKRIAKRLFKEFPEIANKVHDTLQLSDTIILHDTIYIQKKVIQKEKEVVTERPNAQERQLAALLSQAVIWFHFDKYEPILEPAYILDSVASMMKRYPDLVVHVNGHACVIGKDGYNQRLAKRRADAVAQLLQLKGISAKRMKVVSYGASQPYRYNSKHQLSKDRRVEIVPEGYELQPEQQALVAINSHTETENSKTRIDLSKAGQYNQFIGEETIRPGSRLAQIARRWYGVPQYWVYIYEANADKISDYSNVHPGLVVMIPDLTEINEGLTQKQAVEKAKKKERQYLRK